MATDHPSPDQLPRKYVPAHPVPSTPRTDWTQEEVQAWLASPLHDLLHQAQRVHRRHFDPNAMQLSTLLNVKTGGCPEDCAYCPQSARYATGVVASDLLPVAEVRAQAFRAREQGASRFCLGAAWRSLRDRDLERVAEMIGAVKEMGLETCATLGMLQPGQAHRLKRAGLDFYNHNIDTSPEFYPQIISTRTFEDRIETLRHVRAAGLSVCCGGIVGMGETDVDRARMLHVLATMPQHPESVPINLLVRVEGTPLAAAEALDPFVAVRAIATARILMPASRVRLSAGRKQMSDELQALCFHAGANSIFYGERLLTTSNPAAQRDRRLLQRLGMSPE